MLQLLMRMAESFLFVSVCMRVSMHVGLCICVCVCVCVPLGIKFVKAYAWITSERWPQVANLMSPLCLLLCQPPPPPTPSSQKALVLCSLRPSLAEKS